MKDEEEPGEIDVTRLRRRLLSLASGPCVVYGHLLPYVLKEGDVRKVVVLRCEPRTLAKRLRARGYSKGKIQENVEAELIGTVSFDATKEMGAGKTFECDTTKSTPSEAAELVVSIISGHGRPQRFDWMPRYSSPVKLRGLLGSEAKYGLT